MTSRAFRVSQEMLDAYVDWDPGYEPREPLSASQLGFVRSAFYAGFEAAISAAEAIALQWRDENKTAAFEARKKGKRRFDFDGDGTQMVLAEQLDGAAIECNAIAGEIRKLASVDTHPTGEDPTQIGAEFMGSAVLSESEADAQTPPSADTQGNNTNV